jgi:hypothetical protein
MSGLFLFGAFMLKTEFGKHRLQVEPLPSHHGSNEIHLVSSLTSSSRRFLLQVLRHCKLLAVLVLLKVPERQF